MSLPDQTPKLPKLPFLLGDAALLAGAWFIAERAPHPLPLEHTLAIVGCVLGGGLIGVIPFLTDYARRQDEALDERQRGLEALARTVTASAEQISIAAQGLQEITTLAQKNLQDAEQLPLKMQEKMTELRAKTQEKMTELRETGAARMAEKQKADKELAAALLAKTDRLEAVAEQIAKGAADWAKVDAAFHKMVATLEKAPGRTARQKAEASPPPADEPAAAEPAAPVPEPVVPAPEPVAERKPEAPAWESEPEPLPAAAPVAAEPAAESAAPALDLDLPAPVAVAKPPRKPRKPKAEPVAEPSVAENGAADAPAPAVSEFSQVSPEEAAPPAAVSSDGATRLLVTAYIGIGNRLFIRGDGPGLTWEKGVPLQFVSIGKWRWETSNASAPIRFKLYKNDELECAGLGEGTLETGRQQELTASF
jgi:hypothetical protein